MNIKTFTESKKFNSCLNRKLSLDENGYIKNCPSITKDYGHINNIPIKAVVSNSEFKAPWRITKDKVLVCKDCEFRYICSDCRAYVEDPEI